MRVRCLPFIRASLLVSRHVGWTLITRHIPLGRVRSACMLTSWCSAHACRAPIRCPLYPVPLQFQYISVSYVSSPSPVAGCPVTRQYSREWRRSCWQYTSCGKSGRDVNACRLCCMQCDWKVILPSFVLERTSFKTAICIYIISFVAAVSSTCRCACVARTLLWHLFLKNPCPHNT